MWNIPVFWKGNKNCSFCAKHERFHPGQYKMRPMRERLYKPSSPVWHRLSSFQLTQAQTAKEGPDTIIWRFNPVQIQINGKMPYISFFISYYGVFCATYVLWNPPLCLSWPVTRLSFWWPSNWSLCSCLRSRLSPPHFKQNQGSFCFLMCVLGSYHWLLIRTFWSLLP